MQVIGAGFGRTGTLSLKTALERLGYGPCHHMKEVIERPFPRVNDSADFDRNARANLAAMLLRRSGRARSGPDES